MYLLALKKYGVLHPVVDWKGEDENKGISHFADIWKVSGNLERVRVGMIASKNILALQKMDTYQKIVHMFDEAVIVEVSDEIYLSLIDSLTRTLRRIAVILNTSENIFPHKDQMDVIKENLIWSGTKFLVEKDNDVKIIGLKEAKDISEEEMEREMMEHCDDDDYDESWDNINYDDDWGYDDEYDNEDWN